MAAETLLQEDALYRTDDAYSEITAATPSISVFTEGYVMTSLPANCIPVSNTSLPVAKTTQQRWHFARWLSFRANSRIPAGAGSQRPAPLRAGSSPQMLLATLWNTGARINEVLALKGGIFRLRLRIRLCSLRP